MAKRQRHTEIEWRALIKRQQASGQSGLVFCRQQGLNPKSFYRWRKLLGQSGEHAEQQFVQVQRQATTTVSVTDTGPVLQYRDCRVHLADWDPAWVARLIQALS